MAERDNKMDALIQLLEYAPCGVGLFDIETGANIFFNSIYYDLVGYSEQEYQALHRDNRYERIFAQDRHVPGESAEVFKKTGKARHYEYRVVHKDGSVHWLKMSASTIFLDKKKAAFAAFVDITKEKDTGRQLELVAENMGSSFSLFRITGENEELIYANRQFYVNGGMSKEQYLLHTNAWNRTILPQKEHDAMVALAKESLADGKPREVVQQLFRPDGKRIWVRRRFAAVRQDTANSYLLISTATDITEQKNAELRAALEQRRFRLVIQELNAAVIEWDAVSGEFYASEAYKNYAVSAVNAEDILHNRGPLDIVYPDDLPQLQAFFTAANGGKDRTEAVLRTKMKDGSFRWCRMLGFYYRDETGKLLRTVGVLIDINEEHERNFMMTNLLNELPGGVAIFKVADQLECQYFSDGFAAISGKSREEVASLFQNGDFSELVNDDSLQSFISRLKKNTAFDKTVSMIGHFKKADGSLGWIHVSANKIREEDGCPVYYCVFTTPTDEVILHQNIVDDSPIGVYVASRHTRQILFTNDSFRKICGFGSGRVAGALLNDVLEKTQKQPLLTQAEVNSLSYDEYMEFHVERRGLYLAIKAKAVVWNAVDSYIIYMTDETTEHQNGMRLQKMIDEVPAGIGVYEICNHELSLTYLNHGYYDVLGVDRAATQRFFIKNHALEGIHAEDREKVVALVRKLENGAEHGVVVVRLFKGENTWVWFQLSVAVVERKGNDLKGYAVFSKCDDMIKAQEELKRNFVKEQTLMDSIPGGTAIYRAKKDGRTIVEYASEGFCKLTGYSKEELLSNPDITACVYRDDLKDAASAVEKAISEKRAINTLYRIVTKSGQVILNKLDAKVMETEELGDEDKAVLYAVHTRVSDASKLAMREQQYYRRILSMTGTAYFEWDEKNGFYASKEYADYRISEGGIEALSGNQFGRESIHPEDMPLVRFYMSQLDTNENGKSITVRMKMRDGHDQWTEVTSFAERGADGSFSKIVGVFRNVDKEWIEKNKKLQEALDSAERANRAKTAFLSRVSHDMRTPLNGILGLTSFLKDSVTDGQAQQDISQLEISGQYLLNLINDTLDVSRIENGKMELRPVVCDGKEAFDNLAHLARPNIEAKHIAFDVVTKEVKHTALFIDLGRVEQIVMNILGNASKFTPEGGTITYTVEYLSETTDTVLVRISVRDTGIGMSKEFLPTIFDAFSQADNAQTNTRQGTGLGMAITKQLVDLMGGDITVESKLGKGSCFTVMLPLQKASVQQEREWKDSKKQEADYSVLRGKKALLCEDHPLNAQIAVRLLQKQGMLVECAANGKEGVELFERSAQNQYDVILMDIRMPIMDGLTATRKIRSLTREDAHTVPIIAMTGNSFDEDVQQVLDAGMNAHLSKPIDTVKLFEALTWAMTTKQYIVRKKVLVVDDVELNRAVVRAAIEKDYDLVEAGNGVEALEALRQGTDFSAVITDIMMPEMDGAALIRTIRSKKEYDGIAIIANTQYGEMTQEEALKALGANAFIYKPNTPEDVAKKLREAFKMIAK